MPIPTWGEIKIILAALGVAIIAAASAIVTHKIDSAELLKVETQYQAAQIAAVEAARVEQAVLDKAASDADAAEMATQKQLLAQMQTRLGQVAKHVPAGAGNCITWGLIRVIDASALGVDPDSLSLPAGKTDASCASRKASDLAGNIVSNYGVDQSNAERLTALQAYLKQIAAVKR